MRLHLRLANIRSELEILENPEMREIYEDVRQRDAAATTASAVHALIVTPVGTLAVQKRHLEWCETLIASESATRMMPTLQQCLDTCLSDVTVYLPHGRHAIKFAEPLQGRLAIVGRHAANEANGNHAAAAAAVNADDGTWIDAMEDDSKLLTVDGDLRIDGVTFDCRRVRTGIQLRRGRLELRNCRFVGDKRSNTKCALTIAAGGGVGVAVSVTLIDCSIQHFAVGINIVSIGSGDDDDSLASSKPTVRLASTVISECGTAIECTASILCTVHMELGTRIGPNRRYGCEMTRPEPVESAAAKELYEAIDSDALPSITGACEFVSNELGNIVCFNYNVKHLFDEDATPKTPEKGAGEQFVVPQLPKRCTKSSPPGVDEPMSSGSEADEILVESESDMSASVIVVDDSESEL